MSKNQKNACEQARLKTCKSIDVDAAFQILLGVFSGDASAMTYEQLKVRARKLYAEEFQRMIPGEYANEPQRIQPEDIPEIVGFVLEDMATVLHAIEAVIAEEPEEAVAKKNFAVCEQKLGILLEYLSDLLLELAAGNTTDVKQDDRAFLEYVEPYMYGLYEYESSEISLKEYYQRCIRFYRFFAEYLQEALRCKDMEKVKYAFDWSCGPLLFRTDVVRARCLLK